MKSGEETGQTTETVADDAAVGTDAAAPTATADGPEVSDIAEVSASESAAEPSGDAPSPPPLDVAEDGTGAQGSEATDEAALEEVGSPPLVSEPLDVPDPALDPGPTLAPRFDVRPVGLVVLAAILFTLTGLGLRAPPTSTSPPVASAEITSASPSASVAPAVAASSSSSEAADAGPPYTPKWRVAQLKDDDATVVVEGEIGRRPFAAALQQAGLSKAEALRVAKAFEEAHKERPRARDSFVVAREKASGRVVAAEVATSAADVWQAKDDAGRLAFGKLELLVERRTVKAALVVKEDLAQAARDAGLGDDLLRTLEEALDGHVDQGDVKKGARLRVVALEERVERAATHYPRIDAVELAPPRGAKATRVYFYERERDHEAEGKRRGDRAGASGYYDAKGQRPYRGQWRSPVPLARVTSRFNPHRLHPVLKVVMPHNGVDFGAGTGTPVYATAPGTVKSVGDGGPCGNMVQIDHPGGLTTAYCHLSRFAPGIHAGQHVEGRTLVGYVGQTGRVTGPHLHFAVKRGDTFIDPLAMKLDGVKTLPAKDRAAFQKVREARDAELDAIAHGDAASVVEADGGDDEVISDTVDDDAGRP